MYKTNQKKGTNQESKIENRTITKKIEKKIKIKYKRNRTVHLTFFK